MKYSFHSNAKNELFEAIEYYQECQIGLGLEFAEEFYSSIQRLINYPEAWPKLSKNTRRCLLNRFPYAIIYQFTELEIYIIAVMQLNRKPNYWKKRK